MAEPGGPGGPWPPQKFEWVGQGMFWPPQNFDHWPPQNGWPVVKIFAKLLLSTLKCAKISKFFACAQCAQGAVFWKQSSFILNKPYFMLKLSFPIVKLTLKSIKTHLKPLGGKFFSSIEFFQKIATLRHTKNIFFD